MRGIITVLALGSAAAFAIIFGNEADDIYAVDLLLFLAVLALILLVQSGGLAVLYGLVRKVRGQEAALFLTRVAAAVLIAANSYFMAFITFDSSLVVSRLLALGFGILMLAILFKPRWQPPANFMATCFVILSFGLYGYTRLSMESNAKPAGIGLRVKSTRNVYFIGNESLGSPKAFRDIYGVGKLPHVDYLKSHGFRVLDRAYSADHSTVRSWSRIMSFSNTLGESDFRTRTGFNAKNTTFGIFSDSGYKTQFIYKNKYFGFDRKSAAFIFPESGFGQCAFLPRKYFYFLCDKRVVHQINRYIYRATEISPDVVKQRISLAAADTRPWLTVYHHAYPFHTTYKSYKNPAEVQAFKARMVSALPKIRAENFETVLGHILATDPNAVIVTFGDHGPDIWRGAALDVPNKVVSRSLVKEGRFGVLLAVYPASFCPNRIFEGSTTLNLTYEVVKCLNGDDSPSPGDIARSETFYP